MFNFIKEEDGGFYGEYFENKQLFKKKVYMYFLNNTINNIDYNKFDSIIINSLKAIKYTYKINELLDKEFKLYGYSTSNYRYINNKNITAYNLYGIFLGALEGNLNYYSALLNEYSKCKKYDKNIETIEKKYEKCLKLRSRIIDEGFYVKVTLDDDINSIIHSINCLDKLNNIKKSDENYKAFIKSYNLSYQISSILNIDYLEEYYNNILDWIDKFKMKGVNKMPKVKKIAKKI